MKFPIVIEDPGTIILFSSLYDAECDLEAIDVSDGIYKAYDAEGRLLSISTDNNKVIISTFENESAHANELELLLRQHLEDVGKNVDEISRGDLTSLINEAMVFLYTPQTSWMIIKLFIDDLVRTLFSKPICRN